MHRIETRYELIFDNQNRPLEGDLTQRAHGKELVYLASEFLRKRNWKELDKIGKVYLKWHEGVWYIGKFKKGEWYETMALPVIDDQRSTGAWLAILIAARRNGLPFRAYAIKGSWQDWKRFSIRHKRQGTLGPCTGWGHQERPCDKPGGSGQAVASGDIPGFGERSPDSGSQGAKDLSLAPHHGEYEAALASEMASVEGWETRGSADIGMPLGRTSQEN